MSSEATPSLGYLSDVETKVDLLNNEAIAKTVVRLIREKSEHPISVGVHGDWGAGKSSVLEMIEETLSKDTSVLCLKFNGWQFQGFEDAKIALIEGVVHGLIEKRSLWAKGSDEIQAVLKNVDKLKAAKRVAGFAVTAFTGVPAFGFLEMLGSGLEWVKDNVGDKEERDKLLKELGDLKKTEEDKDENKGKTEKGYSIPKEIDDFRKSFKKLIKKAAITRLVVLVDDLDRCLPKTAIETLEAIRLFIFLDKTAFVVGADEGMIEYAVRKHFPDLPETQLSQGYSRAYLEKLLQVPFRIPALGESETHIYVTLLLVGAVLGEDDPAFVRLLGLGREALGKPWDDEVFTSEGVKASLGDAFDRAQAVIFTARQISPVLSAGTKGNPRQIKRFLNALTLRLAVAEARNFGPAIGQAHLAKLMLAEMFLPDAVFSHIATTAANAQDGICPELAEIEALAGIGGLGTEVKAPDAGEGIEERGESVADASQSVLADWKTRRDVMRWASVKPDLGGVSLRPYLFVIKDRKNFLSGSVPLSPKLKALVARLAAGDMAAATAREELTGLSPTDVGDVFKELRGQILASPSFDKKPEPLTGVGALVQAHPGLQGQYVDLLGELPQDKLGFWVTTGHTMVTDPASKARLRTVMEKWAKSKDKFLAKAAQRALAPPKPAKRA